MTTIAPLYKGSDDSFYAVTKDIGESCLANIDAFAALNAQYTPQYVQDMMNSAVAASQMPNIHQRQSLSVVARHALAGTNEGCCNNFSTLMYYASYAFAPDILEARKKEAGAEMYKDAVNQKWRATASLNTMTTSFIGTYSSELTAAGMQEDFPAACDASNTAFTAAYTDYSNYRKGAEDAAAAKTMANNAVYTRLVSVMKDGKFIFKNDELTKKRFVYSAVLNRLRRPGKTGFRFAITNKATNEPIAHAHLSFTNSSVTATSDEQGIIKIEMPDGKYNYMITATGFTTLVGKIATIKGTVRHPKIQMTEGTGVVDTTSAPKKATKEKAAL